MVYKIAKGENLISNLDDEIDLVSKNLVNELKDRGMHIAIAESCTGGLVAKTLTDVSGASNVFECAVVSYSCKIKSKLLGVDESFLNENGPINAETAAQMAKGVKTLANADIGISTTGVAGPGPDGDHKEGEIYVALSTEDEIFVIRLNTNTKNERENNRKIATYNALKLAENYLKGGITLG